MIVIEHDLRRLSKGAKRLRSEIRAERKKQARETGREVLKLEKANFQSKSKGGIGDGGVKWAPLAESTLIRKARQVQAAANRKGKKKTLRAVSMAAAVIGVQTKRMLKALKVIYAGPRSVVVGYEVTTAAWWQRIFNYTRELMPTPLPPKWLRPSEQRFAAAVEAKAKQILER